MYTYKPYKQRTSTKIFTQQPNMRQEKGIEKKKIITRVVECVSVSVFKQKKVNKPVSKVTIGILKVQHQYLNSDLKLCFVAVGLNNKITTS